MATEPATIDLGLLGRDGPDRERRPGRRWRRNRVRLRRWAPALVVLLLLLPLAADAPPPASRITRLWALPDLGFTALTQPEPGDRPGSLLYVRAGRTLTAYRLEDGSAAWQTRIPPAAAPVVELVAGVPVVVADGPWTTAYHPRTGRVLWRRSGVAGQEVAGALLVAAGVGERELVTAVDPHTGEAIGAVTTGSGVRAGWRAPDGALHLFTLGRDGVLARQAMTTGGTERSVQTPFEERLPTVRQNSLSLVGGVLLLTHRASAGRAVAAYDPVTLRHRWTVPEGYRTAPCGPVVCVHVTASGTVEPYGPAYGLDPRTGDRRWSASCTDVGVAGQACTLRVRAIGPGRLWMEVTVPDRYTGGSLATSWLADPMTGERIGAMGRWSLRQAGAVPLLSRSDPRRAPDSPDGPLHWWWARGPGSTTVDILGTVTAHTCTPHDPYLVCWTDGQGVSVWRLR